MYLWVLRKELRFTGQSPSALNRGLFVVCLFWGLRISLCSSSDCSRTYFIKQAVLKVIVPIILMPFLSIRHTHIPKTFIHDINLKTHTQ